MHLLLKLVLFFLLHSFATAYLDSKGNVVVPKNLTIGILIIGTVGDLKSSMAVGLKLKEEGHRVRICSHKHYQKRVLDHGLEFYPIAGDPVALAEYANKLKGNLLPRSLNDLREMRKMLPVMREIMFSSYPAMTAPDQGTGKPFKADAMMANPPAYAHMHIAEKLNIPLHFIFPLPWLKTKAIAHPISGSRFSRRWSLLNKWGYFFISLYEWIGLGSTINKFRRHIGLGRCSFWKYKELEKYPFSFLWSKYLLPAPRDWKHFRAEVVGTALLPEEKELRPHTPTEALGQFLKNGPKPIFIGFGSMIVDHPKKALQLIIQAAQKANVRVIVQSGFTKFEGLVADADIPSNLLLIGAVPHSWLFQQVAAVIHHGGAGTLSAGLLAGLPTMVAPFFGDQYLWGKTVVDNGTGLPMLEVQNWTEKQLIVAFDKLISDQMMRKKAQEIGQRMQLEDGARDAVLNFYRYYQPSQPKGSK